MITEVAISNYRGIRNIRMTPIRRINLITGPNGTGKTTVLEAVWLFHGRHNPILLWNPNVLRVSAPPDLDPLQVLTPDDGGFQVQTKENGNRNVMTVRLEKGTTSTLVLGQEQPVLPIEQSSGTAQPPMPRPHSLVAEMKDVITVTCQDGDAAPVITRCRVQVMEQGLARVVVEPAILADKRPSGVIQTLSQRVDSREVIDRFSQIARAGGSQDLIAALKTVEPRLVSLQVLTNEGQPSLWGELKTGETRSVVHFGDGFGRVLGILLALYQAREGGIVLTDEIDAGIYYKALPDLWKWVSSFAEKWNAQVFATTHNRECIEAVHGVLGSALNEQLAVHRLYRKDSDIGVETYVGERLDAALETGFEVR